MRSRLSSRLPRLRAYEHVLKARLRNPDRTPPGPHAAHLLITWRCNLKCDGCTSWQKSASPELSAGEWRKVLAGLTSLDIVKIIGGEPFMRDDLDQVIAAIREELNPFIVQLVTNATMTDRVVAFVEKHAWPNLHMRVSLDGLGPTHDRSRGVPGTFDRVITTLQALGGVRKRKKFSLAVNFTLTDASLPEVEPLIELCRGMGVDIVPGFKVKPFQIHCDIFKAEMRTIGVKDSSLALRSLRNPGHGARSGFNAAERLCLKAINRLVFRKHAQGGKALKFPCRELRNLIYLNPAGELITCGLNQEAIGNMARDGFDAVWHSERSDAARAAVDRCPGCMQGAVEVMSRLYA